MVGSGDVVNPDLDKDWAAIPEYISSGCMCALVFIMGITMKGETGLMSRLPGAEFNKFKLRQMSMNSLLSVQS